MTPSDKLILVAQLAGAFGVKGEVKITTFTATPLSLLDYGPLLRADGSPGLTLVSARPDKKGLVARAEQITSREQAEAWRGLKLFIPRARLPEPEDDEFYLADLIGLEARDPEGAAIGRVKSVPNFGASDMLEIAPTGGGATWYLPFTREATPTIRIAEGWLCVVRPPESGEPEPG